MSLKPTQITSEKSIKVSHCKKKSNKQLSNTGFQQNTGKISSMNNQTDLTELPENFSHKMADVYNLHVDEFKMSKCCLENDAVDVMLRSEWQTTSRNDFYMLYRWFAAAISIGSVCMTLNHFINFYTFGSFFIYLTNWGLLMNMIVGVLGAVLVYKWHFNTDFQGNSRVIQINPFF